tara:strand:- start:866 stop:1072 length:207 start_codon:yes stop_codon:yes gene_type:complete
MSEKTTHEVSVPSWLIVAAVLGMGPADTLASKLVTGPEYAELSSSIQVLSRRVDELSHEVERLQKDCE